MKFKNQIRKYRDLLNFKEEDENNDDIDANPAATSAVKTLFTVGEELAHLGDSAVPSALADRGGKVHDIVSTPISPTV